MTSLLSARGLCRHFQGAQTPAVNNVSFDLAGGEILALIGPSGCGKTTTLRMIAGFELPDAGTIAFAGKDISNLAPEHRQLGMVFQDYALFPHMNVRDNVVFGAKEKSPATAEHHLAMVGLSGFGERFPDELSGGQQQRVALARSLAAKPKVILLDEPFSNLDAALRQRTRLEIRRLLKASGVGVIMVTHDQEEALGFADRIAVMHDGNILQSGSGQQVYDAPVNAFVASFLGRTNFVEGNATGNIAETILGSLQLPSPHHGAVQLSIRPEALTLTPADQPTGESWIITAVEFRGHTITYWIERQGTVLQADTLSSLRLALDSHVNIHVSALQLLKN